MRECVTVPQATTTLNCIPVTHSLTVAAQLQLIYKRDIEVVYELMRYTFFSGFTPRKWVSEQKEIVTTAATPISKGGTKGAST